MKVNIMRYHSQYIDLEVSPIDGSSFLCTFVYGAMGKNTRLELLNHLEDIGHQICKLWIILGDFNYIANLNERIGTTHKLTEIIPPRQCMETCGLYNLKSNDRFFNWNNKQAGKSRVMSKTDRFLGNHQWEEAFPNVEVTFHSEEDFDHTAMEICFFNPINAKKPFKFYNH